MPKWMKFSLGKSWGHKRDRKNVKELWLSLSSLLRVCNHNTPSPFNFRQHLLVSQLWICAENTTPFFCGGLCLWRLQPLDSFFCSYASHLKKKEKDEELVEIKSHLLQRRRRAFKWRNVRFGQTEVTFFQVVPDALSKQRCHCTEIESKNKDQICSYLLTLMINLIKATIHVSTPTLEEVFWLDVPTSTNKKLLCLTGRPWLCSLRVHTAETPSGW